MTARVAFEQAENTILLTVSESEVDLLSITNNYTEGLKFVMKFRLFRFWPQVPDIYTY